MTQFEEAVDDDEFRKIGSSAKDIFLTFATDFWMEAPAWEHPLRNCSLPNCDAPVCRSLKSIFVHCLKFLDVELSAGSVIPKAPNGSG